MKKIMLIGVAMLMIAFSWKPQEVRADETAGVYDILPGDPEWEQLGSVESKIQACSIDDEVLRNLSDEELMQAVLDYPFIIDLFVANDYETAVQSVRQNSDAFQELLSRENAKDILLDWIEGRNTYDMRTLAVDDELQRDEVMILLMYTNELQQTLTEEDVQIIANFSPLITVQWEEDVLPQSARLSVTTPKGTAVAYTTPGCPHAGTNFHSQLDAQMVKTYNVTLISAGTCKYNCHSYAWYSSSTSNTVWIPDPGAYMTDGSYVQLLSGLGTFTSYVDSGAKVCYGTSSSALHSAILTSSAANVPLSNRAAISKWGSAGVFAHNVSNVPSVYWDSASNISVWH